MTDVLWLDFETCSDLDLKKVGTYRYAEDCQILLAAWAWNDEEVSVTEDFPAWLGAKAGSGDNLVVAHNAMFDRNVLRYVKQIDIPLSHWRCTMVQGLLHGFPPGLEALANALGAPHQKHAEGKRLIRLFSTKKATKKTHPEDWELFKEYAKGDVETMRACAKLLPTWNCRWPEYVLDQTINDRGFAVDVEFCEAAVDLWEAHKQDLSLEYTRVTGIDAKPSARKRFQNWLADGGIVVSDTQAQTLNKLRPDDHGHTELSPKQDYALDLFLEYNKSSNAKYAALLDAVSNDGRFRGGLQFSGAARTRRWSGRTFQPQNLPSRGLPKQSSLDLFIRTVKSGATEYLYSEDVGRLLSASVRGLLVPSSPDKRLFVADLANIEGRIAAWLCSDENKLRAFRESDEGTGPDVYRRTAGTFLGKRHENVNGLERTVFGKIPELALAYQGGPAAVLRTTDAYGVNLRDYAETIMSAATDRMRKYSWDRAVGYEREEERFLADLIKTMWRGMNPRTQHLWGDLENAFSNALTARLNVLAGELMFTHDPKRPAILLRLPSDAYCVYWKPQNTDELSFEGLDPVTKQWGRRHVYGGQFLENACQSIARDVMMHWLPDIEAQGFEILTTVHDEVVCEADADRDPQELAAVFGQDVPWMPGCPIAAEAKRMERYGK